MSAHAANANSPLASRRSNTSQRVKRRSRRRKETFIRPSFIPEQQKTDSPGLPILFVTRVLRVLDWVRAIVDQARRLGIPCKPYIVNKLAHCNTIQSLALCLQKAWSLGAFQ